MATPIPKNEAPFTLAEIALATGGAVVREGAGRARGVSTDTRSVKEGELFVALRGERFDAHDHIRAAAERGAAVVLVSRDVEVDAKIGVVQVGDTLDGLGDLARAHRDRWSARGSARPGRPAKRVIGVTGSAGKTTTKHAVTSALTSLGASVHASAGNLNNAIGVPVSVLGVTAAHDAAVIEMGMNQPGEIQRASAVARPDIALVTLVAAAHTEGVGSIWGVMREKAAIFSHLEPGGVAIANADDELARATLLRAPGRSRHVLYGRASDAHVRLLDRKPLGLAGAELSVKVQARSGPIRLDQNVGLLGRAGTYAALASLAVLLGLELLGDLELSRELLEGALGALGENEGGRLAAKQRADGATILDDAYNANPASMAASIEAASELAVHLDKPLVLVLGGMFELGEHSDALHEEVGRLAASRTPKVIVCVGSAAEPLARAAEAAGATVVRAADAASAEGPARGAVAPGDVVLVKASNSVGLSRVATALVKNEMW